MFGGGGAFGSAFGGCCTREPFLWRAWLVQGQAVVRPWDDEIKWTLIAGCVWLLGLPCIGKWH